MTLLVRHGYRRGGVAQSGTAAAVLALAAMVAQAQSAASTPEAAPAAGEVSAPAGDRRLDNAAAQVVHLSHAVMLAATSAGRRIVAAGERGLVATSDDCGATWKQGKVPVGVSLTGLRFIDELQGWAIGHGGVVLATRDAGATWQKQLDGKAIAQIALRAAKDKAASAPGERSERALRDAERLVADGPDKPLFALHFWSPQRGMVLGAYGLALLTEDGGATWQWIVDRIPNPKGLHLYGLWVHEDRLHIVGEQGLVLRSDDGGKTFMATPTSYSGSFFGVTGIARDGGAAPVPTIYGLRGHVFQATGPTDAFAPLSTGLQATVLTVVPRPGGKALVFDADGRITELQGSRARPVGGSPVGPVLGAVPACERGLVLAGVRGLAVFDPDNHPAALGKGTVK